MQRTKHLNSFLSMGNNKNIPKLRFPEFKDEWERKKFSGILKKYNQGVNTTSEKVEYSNSGYTVIRSNNILENQIDFSDKRYVDESTFQRINDSCKPSFGDVLYCNIGSALGSSTVYTLEQNVVINWNVFRIQPKECINSFFLSQYLNYKKRNMRRFATESTMPFISSKVFSKISVDFPALPEQQKIASFLTAVDNKIQALKKKKELLEQYKKGVMQKIFSQKLRFKDENGKNFPKWEKKKLGELADRITRKNLENDLNVLTISAQQGLINQEKFFNKSVSAKIITEYYLLEKDEFAYNKSYSNGYPMGAIKRLKNYERGVVSTLYICFKFHQNVDLSFMEQYFESGIHNHEIEKVAQEGARNHGLLNIGLNDFFSTEILLPSLQEQTKIANFLSAIDEKIYHCQQQIEKTEQWKKGLLQKMFV